LRSRSPRSADDVVTATALAPRVAASRRFAALAIQAFQASPEASPLPRAVNQVNAARFAAIPRG